MVFTASTAVTIETFTDVVIPTGPMKLTGYVFALCEVGVYLNMRVALPPAAIGPAPLTYMNWEPASGVPVVHGHVPVLCTTTGNSAEVWPRNVIGALPVPAIVAAPPVADNATDGLLPPVIFSVAVAGLAVVGVNTTVKVATPPAASGPELAGVTLKSEPVGVIVGTYVSGTLPVFVTVMISVL